MKSESKKLLCHLAVNSIVLITLYFLLIHLQFYYISIVYLLVGGGFGVAYVIYNRGFSRKGLTPEMLGSSMTEEEKYLYIEDGKQRLKKSRWILTVLIPIIITLGADMIYVFVLPMLGLGE